MSLLEYLRLAAKSESTVYTTFLQQYSKNDNSLHVFHEGREDPSFYGNHLESKTKKGQKIYYYLAKNKDSVYKNYLKLNWDSFSKKRILFLVDKDFSDILNIIYPVDTNIFVTEYYSIENYLVDKRIFSRCLRELFGLEDDKRNAVLTNNFTTGLKTFYDTSIFLSAYILHHKRNNTPLNLQDIHFSDVFELNEDLKVRKKTNVLKVLDKKTGVKTHSVYSSIKKIVEELKQINNPKKYIRGKFELMYMINCMNATPATLNKDWKKGGKQYKCCISLSSKNAIPVLAPRLKIPHDIKSFLFKALK